MGAGHDHDHGVTTIHHEKPLWWALGLTATFLVVEVVAGLLTNSLALLSDAAHMGTDVIALAIALFAVRMSRRPPDAKRTYGYARLEAMAAMVNGTLLFVVAGYILWEAVGRIQRPPEVSSLGMLVVAALGLVINLMSMRLLKAGSGESLNVKGAYLEVWADMLGSIGVIAAAVFIKATGYNIADPIVAAAIGLWVLPRAWTLMKEAGNILIQGVPQGLDIEAVRRALLASPGVGAVHELHAWALGSKERVLTVHVVASDPSASIDALRGALSRMLQEDFASDRLTLQMEEQACSVPH